MSRSVVLLTVALALLVAGTAWSSADDWWEVVGGIGTGSRPGAADGYDGQAPFSIHAFSGTLILLYRQTGPSWSGPTGFYGEDFGSPIPWGDSKTWHDIYLWAQNPSVPTGGLDPVVCTPQRPAPDGYRAELVLDYVPESLDWTGPMVFPFDLHRTDGFWLPLPTLDHAPDPTVEGDKLVRMHITVHAVPEPSSLAALCFGLIAAGAGAQLRRRE